MDLFIYGTLQSTTLMQAVAGGSVPATEPAQLADYGVFRLQDHVVPLIRPLKGAAAKGVVFAGLSANQIARLDLFEGAFGYHRCSVIVTTEEGQRNVACYMPDAALESDGDWSFTGWCAQHEAPTVLAARELFSHNPLPDQITLRAMWPMIENRAWSKHRATAGPATHRYTPEDGDISIAHMYPPNGTFFRYQPFEVTHKQFQGGQSPLLSREIFMGVDAAVLLPYDPVRDRVIMVEQLRMGPVMRHDPNPWMLEPVAGIVDARETPEDAARREAVEEAGVTLTHVEHTGSFYPSPGASTDYYYTYVGLCDLPMDQPYFGGIPGEHEDIRVHPMSFDAAMDLLDTGEIGTGPLFYLLYWLARHRDRLRSLT
ncbi:gamma-glutamylcyclotransferase [Cognatiyoonia sp. IB215446]|uniref:gamma-glutamylcyclotransferase n=1 Tax=Cognatiyoonia sp. IB215446 TaxID=3097355 RepID=UPI002A162982|nr:gamma-glutamylcyclotransferase [Cognatiyoonia sp. IB215446]MDX8348882.1 gamma-glutamylcyclotransferase [Cognatiyoonia sp. IB215446]